MISREIDTGLKGQEALNICDGLMGQLSDGKWENTPKMEPIWQNNHFEMAPDGAIHFLVMDNPGRWNPFISKSNDEILQWLAKHIKAVAKETGLEWARDNVWPQKWYFHGDWTIQQVYFVYETLMGRRDFYKKYPAEVVNLLSEFGEPEPENETDIETEAAEESAEIAYLKSLIQNEQEKLDDPEANWPAEVKKVLKKHIAELQKTVEVLSNK